MTRDQRHNVAPLRLVGQVPAGGEDRQACSTSSSALRDLDWSILMARSQAGDGTAYKTLLEQIIPYLRSLAAQRHRDRRDIEDAVQDILLTVHTIRATYDPLRPFGPWLVAIANRRLVDRLRRQGRRRMRETAIAQAHEVLTGAEPAIDTVADHIGLEKAIESLPLQQQKAVRLLKLRELTLSEASAVSDMSVGSLKAAMHRALGNLRKSLGGSGHDFDS